MERDTLTTYLSLAMSGITLEKKQAEEIVTSFDSLNEQLAKANERVKELEDTVHLLEKDLLRQSVFMINTAAKLEQHREWQATANVLRRPTREAKQALNKFAIEQQIGVLNELAEADKDGTKHVYYRCLSKIEQLRKEQ